MGVFSFLPAHLNAHWRKGKRRVFEVTGRDRPRSFFPFILCCFFLSGGAGLIYEVLWVRMIDKVIGSAPFAVATVLSVFMGGLAFGSYLAGRYIDRLTSRVALLSLYGKLEIVIGVYALVLPFLIAAVTPLYSLTYDFLLPYFWCYQFFAFLGCLVLLIIPTSLMGATLPVLCRFYVTHLDHVGTRTGRLYGLNTVGAALGAILCGFLLINRLGVWATLFVAAGINFLVGASCILLSQQKEVFSHRAHTLNHRKMSSEKIQHPESASSVNGRDKTMTLALWIFAVSGFCAMAYEVFWARLLGLIIGPTSYSFTLVVSTFIIGLALGSIVFGWVGDRTKRVFFMLALTQLCASGLALAVSQFLGNSQFFFSKLIHTFQDNFATMMLVQSIVLFAILLGPTIFLGATFPLVNRIYSRSISVLGKSIGTAYAINTIGAILGSFAAGFLLIPLAGKENGLRLVIMLQFVMAVMALLIRGGFGRQKKNYQWLLGGLAVVLGIILISNFPSWKPSLLSRGWYRDFQDIENELDRTSWLGALWRGPALLTKERRGLEVVFYGDGIGGFTTVEKETTSIDTVEYALYNSGKPDASSHGDRSTQTLSGHVPLLFHPNPEKVMVVGLASGMTPGEVLLYPVKQLDILEINDQVVKACRLFFSPWNNACLSDPRTRLVVQDGRNHLALTRERYDVIISEPSNPWMAGCANLFTLEFFLLIKDRLKEDGLFAQWIQSYEMDWDTFAMVGRTFKEAFPNGALMKIGPGDYLLLGFVGQRGLDWKVPERNIRYARNSTNVSLADFHFLVHLIMTEDLQKLFGTGPLHTDNWPRLEFSAPRQLYGGTLNIDKRVAERRRLSSATGKVLEENSDPDTLLDLVEFASSANVPLFSMFNLEGLTPFQKGRYIEIVQGFCGRALVPSYDIFAEPESKKKCAEIHISKIRHRLAMDNSRAFDHYNLSLALIAAGKEEEAIRELETTIALDPFHEDGHTALGLLLAESGRLPEAVEYFARVVEISPRNARAYKNLGIAEARQGKSEQAVTHLSAALQIVPDDVGTLNELGCALLRERKVKEAIKSLSKALMIDPQDAESHHNLAVALYQEGELEKAAKHFSEALRISPDNANVRHNLKMVSRLLKKARKASGEAS
jgi:spermidine synthase